MSSRSDMRLTPKKYEHDPIVVHRESAMTRDISFARHMRSPGDDGYRTPTIEDTENDLTEQASGATLFQPRGSRIRQAHTSALQALHISSYRKSEGDGVQGGDDLALPQSAAEASATALGWKKRIRHITWAFFTLTMATGGIANVLYFGKYAIALRCILVNVLITSNLVPYRFRGLDTIGIVFFLFNLVLYVLIWCLLIARFYLYPYTFKASFLHPTESLFVPASLVSFGTILINISQYGPDHTGPWLTYAVGILFWIDAALAVISSAGIYLIL